MERVDIQPKFRVDQELNRLLIQNELFELLTFRLYRFWARTALRRYLWSAISIDGVALEYTGETRELVTGFLLAFSLLALPLMAICSAAAVAGADPVASSVVVNAWYVAFFFAMAAGRYQATRYRLSCTLWRGITAGLEGSALTFALRQLAWHVAFCLTAGLSVPWACTDLARYQVRHTHWGNFAGRFGGTATDFIRCWLPVWALCCAPLYAAVIWSLAQSDWNLGAIYVEIAHIFDFVNDRENHNFLYLAVAALLCCRIAATYFRLRWWEWFINSISLGPIRFSCQAPSGFPPRLAQGLFVLAVYAFGATYVVIETNLGRGGLFADWGYTDSVWGCLALTMIAAAGGHLIWLRLVDIPLLGTVVSHTTVMNCQEAETARQVKRVQPRMAEGFWDIAHANLI